MQLVMKASRHRCRSPQRGGPSASRSPRRAAASRTRVSTTPGSAPVPHACSTGDSPGSKTQCMGGRAGAGGLDGVVCWGKALSSSGHRVAFQEHRHEPVWRCTGAVVLDARHPHVEAAMVPSAASGASSDEVEHKMRPKAPYASSATRPPLPATAGGPNVQWLKASHCCFLAKARLPPASKSPALTLCDNAEVGDKALRDAPLLVKQQHLRTTNRVESRKLLINIHNGEHQCRQKDATHLRTSAASGGLACSHCLRSSTQLLALAPGSSRGRPMTAACGGAGGRVTAQRQSN